MFAGIGGSTLGAQLAGVEVIWAANHWPAAVEWHTRNHPATQHSCQDLHQADWTQVPAHDLLLASPACQGHTHARGKERPHHDALRSTAWAVVDAVEAHLPEAFIAENVCEFTKWVLYAAWCGALNALGYALAPIVTDAADHGVPQHRVRLFVIGTRSKHPIALRLPRRAHVPASNVIDFTAGHWSPIERPGRSAAQLARVAAGRQRFGSRFLTPYYGSGSGLTGRSLDRPIGTLTTRDRYAVVDGDRMRMLTVDESRQFMSFPAGYHLPAQKAPAVMMLGNAVPPIVERDVIHALMEAA